MKHSNDLPKYRIKVEKNINKEAVLLKLRFNYFFVFVAIVIGILAMLLSSFTMKSLFVAIVISVGSYMLIHFLDKSNALDDLAVSKLPRSIENDLYELNDEIYPVIKKSPDTKH
ncbi:hypothetical protein [Arenibacter sp. F20364]|jgi:hypothetical protein|uniref:hypothetical protein n=1 Tax=Arenibacter sp. F20364 TaxID=2926415 RepID=UPI001FF38CF8|nr:hypothetical protein [Arenibacter sp. F20364]MCK0192667.1 hypothetical protein [Arenibacter sp. F20364]